MAKGNGTKYPMGIPKTSKPKGKDTMSSSYESWERTIKTGKA